MGGGRWSTDVYKEKEHMRKASGKSAFAYSDKARKSGKLKPHETLDPFGVGMRESRDSEEHPNSNAITVLFDVTGSMHQVPVELQKVLPQLLGLLLYKNYIPDPQILFGAIGDAYSDRVPLQVGQFESDNRMDEHLQNMVLEGGGGGTGEESYELAMYFMARHTLMDCWEKRKQKGYLFIIGDERAYDEVNQKQVAGIINDGLKRSIPLEKIIAEVKEKYHLFRILPTNTTHGSKPAMYEYWKNLVGEQHVLRLDDVSSIAETIALTIGMNEGTIGFEDGVEDLKEMGSSADVESLKKALAVRPDQKNIISSNGSIGDLDDDDTNEKTRRL